MRFRPTSLDGCVIVESDLDTDERGAFGRLFCAEEFASHGLDPRVAQCSLSLNRRAGTLRGLHYQRDPYAEARLVTCTRGRIFDVAADIRTGSATFGQWTAVELDASRPLALYVAPGLAHGFMTLEDDSEVRYQMSTPYRSDAAAGIRWDDPDVGIDWPDLGPIIQSARDRDLPSLANLGRGPVRGT